MDVKERMMKRRYKVLWILLMGMSSLFVSFAWEAEEYDRGRITELHEEEVIRELFEITSEMEWIRTEKTMLEEQWRKISEQIQEEEAVKVQHEARLEEAKDQAKKVLRRLQKSPGITVIFTAEDFSDLLKKTGTIRTMSNKTKEVLEKLRGRAEEMQRVLDRLASLRLSLEEKRRHLEEREDRFAETKALLDARLQQLRREREGVERKLEALSAGWTELKALFVKTSEEIRDRIHSGRIPRDTVHLQIGLFGARASITSEKMNALDSRMKFVFGDGVVEVRMDEVFLRGTMVLKNAHTVAFEVDSGTFRGFDLSDKAVKDLNLGGQMSWDFKAFLGESELTYVRVRKDMMELGLKIGFGGRKE